MSHSAETPTPRPRILLVGNICKDIIYTTDSYPAEDTKVKALSKAVRIGGNTGNITQIMAQFRRYSGIHLSCCVKLGSCQFSDHVKGFLTGIGVDVRAVCDSKAEIPESVIFTSKETASRTCLHYRGACEDLTWEHVMGAVELGPGWDSQERGLWSWIHLEHRRNGLAVLAVARKIRHQFPKVVISIDIEKVRDGFDDMLGVVDYPIISKEVCKTLGYPTLESALTGLAELARKCIIVTWGDRGAGVFYKPGLKTLTLTGSAATGTGSGTSTTVQILNPTTFICPVVPVPVTDIVDSLGAGDSFTAGLIYSLGSLREAQLPAAVSAACRVARSKLGHEGMVIDPDVL